MENIRSASQKAVESLLGITKDAVVVNDKRPWYQRPVSSTVGRPAGWLAGLMLGDKGFFGRTAGKEDLGDLLSHGTDMDTVGNDELAVNMGGVRPIDNLKRIFARKDLGTGSKVIGPLLSLLGDAQASLMRSDHYNPWAHSTTLFNKSLPVMSHELGHAEDFSSRKFPGLYALLRGIPLANIPATLYQEGVASSKGMDRLDTKRDAEVVDPEERQALRLSDNRKLTAALGSYLGSMVPIIPGGPMTALVAGHAVGSSAMPFSKQEDVQATNEAIAAKKKNEKGQAAEKDKKTDDEDEENKSKEMAKAALASLLKGF